MCAVTPTREQEVEATRKRIAAEVRAEMGRQGKTRAFLVDLLQLEPSVLSLRLHGKRAFKAEELTLIAEALEVPVTQFTERAS